MASADHLERLRQGGTAWNNWRRENPSIIPDFSEGKLSGADLSEAKLSRADFGRADLGGAQLGMADLCGANLSGADLSEAKLSGADLSFANLRGANLRGARLLAATLCRADLSGVDLSGADLSLANLLAADLCVAKLSGANLRGANLSGLNLSGQDLRGQDLRGARLSAAILRGANLSGAHLMGANLIDACLDHADLTGAWLWETQRTGWSIKGVICQRACWDRGGVEQIEYGVGEFERIFAEKPRIVLRYAGGMSPIDLFALPFIVERLQAEYPDSALQVRSVQNDSGGASVTITVEDRTGRGPEAFRQELALIRTKLECVVEERDYLRRLLTSMISQGVSKIAEFLALPRQEIHVHRPTGLTTIEGPITMSGDTYSISGQAGAVGPGAHAHDNTFQQVQGGIDLPKFAEELGRLRAAMKGEATGTREQDKAIGAVADAEEAAVKGDGTAALRCFKGAGTWALGIAEKIGVPVLIEVAKSLI